VSRCKLGKRRQAERRGWVEVIRVPGGCLFWILISVVLSVGLTVLANLVLYVL
jgi:hypothetical protein